MPGDTANPNTRLFVIFVGTPRWRLLFVYLLRPAMVSDFVNPAIFWEHDVSQLDPDKWASFIVKQVFNRNVVTQTLAIPSLVAYYGKDRVEHMVRDEEWLTSTGIKIARQYFPHLKNKDFKASVRINRRKRELAKAGEFNPKL